jgi:hypothetical protein
MTTKFKDLREATKANPYAIGMAVAKKKAGITAAHAHDIPKAVIVKGHEIAKKIKANEEFDDVLDQVVVEDTELVDETSKELALRYLDKAPRSARINGQLSSEYKNAGERKRNPGLKKVLGNLGDKYKKKAWKREDGIKRAIKKIAGDK